MGSQESDSPKAAAAPDLPEPEYEEARAHKREDFLGLFLTNRERISDFFMHGPRCLHDLLHYSDLYSHTDRVIDTAKNGPFKVSAHLRKLHASRKGLEVVGIELAATVPNIGQWP